VRLPGGDRAIVDPTKLTDYVLSEAHPRGRNKARVFCAALGLTQFEAAFLESALIAAAAQADATLDRTDAFGAH